jgi:hypothetical protein
MRQEAVERSNMSSRFSRLIGLQRLAEMPVSSYYSKCGEVSIPKTAIYIY